MAYTARYGHQPLPILTAMTRMDFYAFHSALCRIVSQENSRSQVPSDE